MGMINDYLQEKKDVTCFFELNTTWKGKLINQIESNSRIRSTCVYYIKY